MHGLLQVLVEPVHSPPAAPSFSSDDTEDCAVADIMEIIDLTEDLDDDLSFNKWQ